MREMSVTEQRYQAVLGVMAEGRAVMEVASQWGVRRRTVHRWLARNEAKGLEGLLAGDESRNREAGIDPHPGWGQRGVRRSAARRTLTSASREQQPPVE